MSRTVAVICADLDGARSTIQIVADAIDVDEAGAVYVYQDGIVVGYVPVVHFAYLNVDDVSAHVSYDSGDANTPAPIIHASLNGSMASASFDEELDEELDEDDDLDEDDFDEDDEETEDDEEQSEVGSSSDPGLPVALVDPDEGSSTTQLTAVEGDAASSSAALPAIKLSDAA